MRKGCLRFFLVAGTVAVLLIAGFWTRQRFAEWAGAERPATESPAERAAAVPSLPAPDPGPKAGRDPRTVDSWALQQARRHMKDPRQARCGPYQLETDMRAGSTTGADLVEICKQLAAPLDQVFEERFGIDPRGEPREAVFLFAHRESFRAFARESGRLRAGYAAYADGSRGFVALPAGDDEDAFAQTLAHELTHLVLRRALGPGLPPWLSEGLADAVGDPASPEGLQPLLGLRGVEGQARRLRDAYRRQPAGLGLERLAALDRASFDQGSPAYDYEQSALFVRYLLLDESLAPLFRHYLARLAAGQGPRPELLTETLGRSWAQLDDGFRSWLETGPPQG